MVKHISITGFHPESLEITAHFKFSFRTRNYKVYMLENQVGSTQWCLPESVKSKKQMSMKTFLIIFMG